jgi:hypothetical protein
LVDELLDLLDGFAIDLHAYAIMSNHYHLVLRTRPDRLSNYESSQIVRLGMRYMPVRTGVADECLPITEDVVARYARNNKWISEYRGRLSSISWFMRQLNQHIALKANQEDGCRGHFWESRFTCVPLLDWSAVLACMVYVDLNPYRAHMVDNPIEADYCSLRGHVLSPVKRPDRKLSRHLTRLSSCCPIDSITGKLGRARLSPAEYKDVVYRTCGLRLSREEVAKTERLGRRLGYDWDAWCERMGQPGMFQSGAVGDAKSRQAHAKATGKKWIADKTRIWVGGG